MFLLNLPVNIKEQAAIERRQREEKERLSRIFNEKYRTIGIDKTGLDEQIEERQRMKRLEKQRNDAFDREMIRNDLNWIYIDEEAFRKQRQLAQELNDYRRLYQKPEDTREWDLNNPDNLKYQTPARISDDDARLGPSSGQIFIGEDLQGPARRKAQQEQLKKYFDEQTKIKTKKDEQERLANLVYDCKQIELSKQSDTFEEMENECHRAMEIATRNYNELLATETKIRANERKSRETEEQLSELANTTFSDMLTENSKDILDSRHRIIVDRWKGMNQDQLDDIRHQQLAQIDERRKMNNIQKNFDEVWGRYASAIAKQEIIREQEIDEKNRLCRRYLDDENQNLARVQREHQDYLNSVVYRSVPTAAFYQQFNTTSR